MTRNSEFFCLNFGLGQIIIAIPAKREGSFSICPTKNSFGNLPADGTAVSWSATSSNNVFERNAQLTGGRLFDLFSGGAMLLIFTSSTGGLHHAI